MGQRELLVYLVKLFDRFHLPYLLTGGFAVSYYGRPRSTLDIDFITEVVKKNLDQLKQILNQLNEKFIYNKSAIINLGEETTEFNVVYEENMIKVDFWTIKENDFNERFARKHVIKIDNNDVNLISPEDLILTKLRWCNEIFSERHFTDCQGIIQVQKGKLDKVYMKKAARKLGILHLLKEATS